MKKWYNTLSPIVKTIVDIILMVVFGFTAYGLYLLGAWIYGKFKNPSFETKTDSVADETKSTKDEIKVVSEKQTASYSQSMYEKLANEAFGLFNNNFKVSDFAYKSWRSKIHHYVDYLRVADAFGSREVDVSDIPFSGTELCTLDTMISKRCKGTNEEILADWNGSKAGWYSAFKKLIGK